MPSCGPPTRAIPIWPLSSKGTLHVPSSWVTNGYIPHIRLYINSDQSRDLLSSTAFVLPVHRTSSRSEVHNLALKGAPLARMTEVEKR